MHILVMKLNQSSNTALAWSSLQRHYAVLFRTLMPGI